MHEDSKEYTFIKEGFITSPEDMSSLKTMTLIESLNKSTDNNMYFKQE